MDFKLLEAKAKALGISEIELYTKADTSISITAFDDEISEKTEAVTKVYAIRGVYNNQIGSVYTEKDTEDEIDNFCQQLVTNCTYLNKDEPYFIYPGDKDYKVVEEPSHDYLNIGTRDKINLVLNINKALKTKNDLYFHAESSYEEIKSTISIENSNGLNVQKEYSYAVVVSELNIKFNDDIKNAYNYLYLKNLKDFNLTKFVEDLTNDTIDRLHASTIKSGSYKVILSNKVLNKLMAAFASSFSAFNVKRKISFLEGKLNTKIFNEKITILDDPFYKDMVAIRSFDDEGVATKTKTLVENGVLKSYLHNLSTASYYNTKSTGNGLKPNVRSEVGIAPLNLYLKPGTKSFNELLEEVKDGILITNITGLHAGINTVSGDFNLQSSGYIIKDGKKANAITLIVLSGNFIDLLNNVVSIASDTYTDSNMSMPSIYVEKMNISGN